MRKPNLVAAVLSLWACSPEDLEALHQRAEVQLNELSHQVRVRFDDGTALLTVSRKIRNDTTSYQELGRTLHLPSGAIATGMRVSTDGAWPVQGTLTSSEEAAARWDMLTSPGEAAPTTVAKLDWEWEGGLALNVFGLAPGATLNLEYDLELPPDYGAGELSFEYPRGDPDTRAPEFQLGSARLEHVSTETESDAEDTSSGFLIRQPHHLSAPFAARWATYPLEVDRSIFRLEVDFAAQLGAAPVRPNVVFVIDASHSQGPAGIAAQLELIVPYLDNARDAQVELVVYRRFAERVFGRFVPALEVARLLASTPPERFAAGNGSNLEVGARLAAESLSQVGGPARVILFTDEAMRFGFTNELATEAFASAPRETVVHLVDRIVSSGDGLSEQRDDSAQLSPIATAGGGVFLRIEGRPVDPVLSADTLLGLVRPIRIDSFAIDAAGFEQLGPIDSVFLEGSTIRDTAVSTQPPDQLVITGKLWARELRQVVQLDRALSNRLPGFSIGDTAVRAALSEEELKTVAYISHAVSPVTSYFAAAPDAAASTAGVLRGGTGGSGVFGSTCGCGGSSTSCGIGRAGVAIDYEGILRGLLAPGVSACEQRYGDASMASLKLEATGDEAVDVIVSAPTAELTDCLTEAAWAVRLSPVFGAHRFYELNTLGR